MQKKSIGETRDYSPEYGKTWCSQYHPLSDKEEKIEKEEDKDNLLGVDVRQMYDTWSPVRPMGRKGKEAMKRSYAENLELGFKIKNYDKDKEELTLDVDGKDQIYQCNEYNYKHLADFIKKGWLMNAVKVLVNLKELKPVMSNRLRSIAKRLRGEKKVAYKGEILDRAILRNYLKDDYEFDSEDEIKKVENYVRKTIIDALRDQGLMQNKSEEALV